MFPYYFIPKENIFTLLNEEVKIRVSFSSIIFCGKLLEVTPLYIRLSKLSKENSINNFPFDICFHIEFIVSIDKFSNELLNTLCNCNLHESTLCICEDCKKFGAIDHICSCNTCHSPSTEETYNNNYPITSNINRYSYNKIYNITNISLNKSNYLKEYNLIIDNMNKSIKEISDSNDDNIDFLKQVMLLHNVSIELSKTILKHSTDKTIRNIALEIISINKNQLNIMKFFLNNLQNKQSTTVNYPISPKICTYNLKP